MIASLQSKIYNRSLLQAGICPAILKLFSKSIWISLPDGHSMSHMQSVLRGYADVGQFSVSTKPLSDVSVTGPPPQRGGWVGPVSDGVLGEVVWTLGMMVPGDGVGGEESRGNTTRNSYQIQIMHYTLHNNTGLKPSDILMNSITYVQDIILKYLKKSIAHALESNPTPSLPKHGFIMWPVPLSILY